MSIFDIDVDPSYHSPQSMYGLRPPDVQICTIDFCNETIGETCSICCHDSHSGYRQFEVAKIWSPSRSPQLYKKVKFLFNQYTPYFLKHLRC